MPHGIIFVFSYLVMKYTLLLMLTLYLHTSFAATVDTITLNNTPLVYHYEQATQPANKLIIYMHGGVSQFKGKTTPVATTTLSLTEGNTAFLPAVTAAGYDVILPVAYNDYNWLEPRGEEFINALFQKHQAQYDKIFIAGFSDGATGAFRFFYNHPEKFDGAMVFNGYPQLKNYHKTVDHSAIADKHLIYVSTDKDKVIPYEFLLIEFRRQMMLNEHTYFILREGGHNFTAYSKQDIELCMKLLGKENAASKEVYPPFDGLIIDHQLVELYPFRKKNGKGYNMHKEEYARTDYDYKEYKKLLDNGANITIRPVASDLHVIRKHDTIPFRITIDNEEKTVKLNNWLNLSTW